MASEEPPQIDYERAIASALAMLIERSGGIPLASVDQPAPGWLSEFIDALAPLKALAPSHGEIPEQEATKLTLIQNALRRADLSKAAPSGAPVVYIGRITIQKGGRR